MAELTTFSDVEVFLCYAQEDSKKIKGLKPHLGLSRRQGFFAAWHDCPISAGEDLSPEIVGYLRKAHSIIVLVLSSSFLDSDSCIQVGLVAIEQREAKMAMAIPVLLRPCYYQRTPYAKLQLLPRNGKPIAKWSNRDEAFHNVAGGIRDAAEVFLIVTGTVD